MRKSAFQENRFLISVYYIIMLLTSYIVVISATILKDPSDESGHNEGSEQVAIVAYASTLAMDGAASEWCKTRRLPPSLPKLNERPTGAASLLTAGLLMVVLWARKETPGLDSGKC